MRRAILLSGVCFLILGCQSTPQETASNETIPTPSGPVFRYLAWMEGSVQTGYEPDRTIAETKLKQWEGKVPDKKDTEAYLDYLAVLGASGRTDESEKKIKEYLTEFPNEKRAVFLLAAHYLRIKKKEIARYFLDQLEKDGQFAWKSLLYNNLGMLALHEEKNRGLALSYLEKAVKASPATAAPFVNLGALYLESRSYVDAEKMFAKAEDLDSDFEDAVLGWGVALEGQGKFEEAHKRYAAFIDSHPDALSVLYNDSVLLGNRLKKRDQAAQQMLRYIQRGGKETARAHEMIQTWR